MQNRMYHRDMVVRLCVHGYVFVAPMVLYNSNCNTDKHAAIIVSVVVRMPLKLCYYHRLVSVVVVVGSWVIVAVPVSDSIAAPIPG